MNDKQKHPAPVEINLHQKSRILSLSFSDGKEFRYPCEYLRVYSKAAEVQSRDNTPAIGKEQVNIDSIEPQGSYAIRIIFDDGHDTGIYSWESLYDLGINMDKYWQAYLDRLAAAGYSRKEAGTDGSRQQLTLNIMYFSYLVDKLGQQSETIKTPPSVVDVQSLLTWLAKIKRERGYLLAEDNVRTTVNKQFSELFTRLDSGDEVGIIPNSPNPPKPPG